MEENTDRHLLEKCYELIEQKLNWGKSESWTNYHYNQLSELINEHTHISISILTFKRMFGKVKTINGHYNPHISTRNALVVYLGYKNWLEFVEKQKNAQPEKEIVNLSLNEPSINNRFKQKRYLLLSGGLLLGIFLLVFILFYLNNPRSIFSIREPNDTFGIHLVNNHATAPATLLFQFKVPKWKDSTFIKYNDPTAKWERDYLDPKEKNISHVFDIPSYYTIDILEKRKKVSEIKAHVLSNGWQPCLFYSTLPNRAAYNRYELFATDTKQKGVLHIDMASAKAAGYDTTTDNLWSFFYYVDTTRLKIDNMTFEARLKGGRKNSLQFNNQVMITLIGENQDAFALYTHTCCFYYAATNISKESKWIHGSNSDMRFLSADFSDFRTLRWNIKNKVFSLSIDGNQVKDIPYKKPFGSLKGIRIAFWHKGWLDYVHLFDSTGKEYKVFDF